MVSMVGQIAALFTDKFFVHNAVSYIIFEMIGAYIRDKSIRMVSFRTLSAIRIFICAYETGGLVLGVRSLKLKIRLRFSVFSRHYQGAD